MPDDTAPTDGSGTPETAPEPPRPPVTVTADPPAPVETVPFIRAFQASPNMDEIYLDEDLVWRFRKP